MVVQGTTSAAAVPVVTPTADGTSTPSDRELEKRRHLQHFLVMKAFNLRKGKPLTLAQQFHFLKTLDPSTGRSYLELGPLCAYLSIPPFRRLVLGQIFRLTSDAPTTRLDFDAFVRFLQTAVVQAAQEEQALRRLYSAEALPQPPVSASIRENQESHRAIVCFAPSLLSMRFARPPPAPGLWKKREITIQERITEYTKIDEHGRAQHLVESEKHQSEVVHMESLHGEFAHREVTQFEQLEKLNEEIVHHETGREEFVHLKSQHDEVSKFESSIPTTQNATRPEECEQPPPSPTIKRDPSTMDCGDPKSFQSPGRSGSARDADMPMDRTPEEEEAYDNYNQRYIPEGDLEMESLLEDGYPLEPQPHE